MTQRVGRLKKNGVNLNYLVYSPSEMEVEQKLPLIIFLHGIGQRGEDLELLKLFALPQLLESKSDFPFIVVSPQCPSGSYWHDVTDKMIALIDEVIIQYPVDPSRVYLTGISMGGYGAWSLASEYPERFAALVPLCGGGDPGKAKALRKLPIWAFHGAKDDIVPVQETLKMVKALKKYKGNIKLTIYPEAGHDLTGTYKDPMLYEWLLEHTLLTFNKPKASVINEC